MFALRFSLAIRNARPAPAQHQKGRSTTRVPQNIRATPANIWAMSHKSCRKALLCRSRSTILSTVADIVLTMTTTAELIIHLDNADGEVVWWAESPQVPGLTAAASSLAELRELAMKALRDELSPTVEVVEIL